MVHQGQHLPLRLEARDDFPGVHSRFDDLERHLPFHRIALFCQIDRAEPAFPDLPEQLVAPDHVALLPAANLAPERPGCGIHESPVRKMSGDQRPDLVPQRLIADARLVEIGRPFR